MGIVNVTPDSFYDGGRHDATAEAVEHGLELARQGADILDVGGESTRPGSEPVPEAEEMERVIPVIERLAAETDLPVSVDTTKASVASEALRAGAHWINDISAGLMDTRMLAVAAEAAVPYVAMHMRGTPRTMQRNTDYDNLVEEIVDHFHARLAAFDAAGIAREKVLLDPGIGFGKKPEHNYRILARIGDLHALGQPLLLGPSRKSFLKLVGAEQPDDRLPGTVAAVTVCAMAGVEVVRVHDVEAAVQAVRIVERINQESAGTP
jgi:dihydropteroate synthase